MTSSAARTLVSDCSTSNASSRVRSSARSAISSSTIHSWREASRDPYLFEASLPGVFAVGDVRSGAIRRAASAAGEGSMAVRLCHAYLAEISGA